MNTVHLTQLRLAIASLTNLVQEQALEIGELQNNIISSLQKIVTTTEFSKETLITLTLLITSNQESLSALHLHLAHDSDTRATQTGKIISFISKVHSTTDSKLDAMEAQMEGLTNVQKVMVSHYECISTSTQQKHPPIWDDTSSYTDSLPTASTAASTTTSGSPGNLMPKATHSAMQPKHAMSQGDRLQTLISKYTTSPSMGGNDTVSQLTGRTDDPAMKPTSQPTIASNHDKMDDVTPLAPITFCLSCYW